MKGKKKKGKQNNVFLFTGKLTRTFYLVPAASSSQQPRVVRRMQLPQQQTPQQLSHNSQVQTAKSSIQSQPPSTPSTTSTTPVGNGSEQVFYYSPYSAHDSSPQSLPEDQLDSQQGGEYEYWDDKMEYSDNSLNGNVLADYDVEEEHIQRSRPTNPGQITVVQPLQHHIVENHQKYYKVGR